MSGKRSVAASPTSMPECRQRSTGMTARTAVVPWKPPLRVCGIEGRLWVGLRRSPTGRGRRRSVACPYHRSDIQTTARPNERTFKTASVGQHAQSTHNPTRRAVSFLFLSMPKTPRRSFSLEAAAIAADPLNRRATRSLALPQAAGSYRVFHAAAGPASALVFARVGQPQPCKRKWRHRH